MESDMLTYASWCFAGAGVLAVLAAIFIGWRS